MASPLPFVLENLIVEHVVSPMKIGTDALLLGAYPKAIAPGFRCLDIGSGCGIITLMTARNYPLATYTCIDIDNPATEECNKNIARNQMHTYCHAINQDIKYLQDHDNLFQVIFSNPPYFSSELKSANTEMRKAKHRETLTFTELAESVSRLLCSDGLFYIILPQNESFDFQNIAIKCGLMPIEKLLISSFKDTKIIREITTYKKADQAQEIKPEHLFLYQTSKRNDWSEGYKQMLRNFKKFE